MMSACQSPQAIGHEHRWEFGYIRNGEEYERCMNASCGEERFCRYQDTQGG
jgi:hypothetical protein